MRPNPVPTPSSSYVRPPRRNMRTVCLRVAHLDLEETFWYAVHFLDLYDGVLWAFMTRRVESVGQRCLQSARGRQCAARRRRCCVQRVRRSSLLGGWWWSAKKIVAMSTGSINPNASLTAWEIVQTPMDHTGLEGRKRQRTTIVWTRSYATETYSEER